jgi:D-serine deaminase-like pyridoxal phosphate-dependent protein
MTLRPGLPVDELDTPALCIDVSALNANIARMADFFSRRPADLRPHAKTHKSPLIARKQLEAGAIGVTCAKLGEAEVIADAGIKDILIANQIVGPKKIDRLVSLAADTDVMVAADHPANVANLGAAAEASGVRVRVLVEVDIGMRRCGVAPGKQVVALARQIADSPALDFEGLMGYEGHTVTIPDYDERKEETKASLKLLLECKKLVEEAGMAVPIVSGGGTGTYDITGDYPGVTEVQAGSYATMDVAYRDAVQIDFECAVFITAQTISTPRPDIAIVDAGLKTMSRDFGLPMVAHPRGWKLIGLSEEHGKLIREGGPALKLGDRVRFWPRHGCTTINLHESYVAIQEGIAEAIWPIAARGKIR